MLKNLLIATTALIAAGSAQAVTFTTAPFGVVPAGQHVIDSFEAPVAGIALSGSYTIDNMNVSGIRAEPAGDTTNYFATPGSNDATPGTATIDFSSYLGSKSLKSFSFYWGSTDTYNTLTLLGTGLTGQTVYTGSDVNPPANGDQSSAATNRTVNWTFAPGEHLTGIQLTSTGRAFEIDNLAGNVPEPATWALMVMGFGLVGVSVRRRRPTVVAA